MWYACCTVSCNKKFSPGIVVRFRAIFADWEPLVEALLIINLLKCKKMLTKKNTKAYNRSEEKFLLTFGSISIILINFTQQEIRKSLCVPLALSRGVYKIKTDRRCLNGSWK